ncbi:MAG: hypothetical protein ACK5TR_06755 [Alphaproteobacteria bacterium]
MHLIKKNIFLTFIFMFLAALIFGLCSYNLFSLLSSNLDLIVDHGVMALRDGALKQLVMLIFYGIISLCAYVAFKVCEHILVDRLVKHSSQE